MKHIAAASLVRSALGIMTLGFGLCIPMLPAYAAAEASVETTIRSVAEHMMRGELAEATRAIAELDALDGQAAVARRLTLAVQKRREEARRLDARAAAELSRGELGLAERLIDAAGTIDNALDEGNTAHRVRAERARLDPALAGLAGCMQRRQASCLAPALAGVRAIDRHNAAAVQAELLARDWFAVRNNDAAGLAR